MTSDPHPPAPLAVGQVRTHQALGLRSVYGVRGIEGEHVSAEVIRVPGLRPGTIVRLRRSAVEAMALEDVAASAGDVDDELRRTLAGWAA